MKRERIVKFGIFLLLLSLFITVSGISSFADPVSSSPNYLIILIHGIGSNYKGAFIEEYGNLEKYLKQDLGLDGYVYGYDFLNSKGSNIDHAKELADPSYPDNWFVRARNEFIDWYASNQKPPIDPKDVPESVIPDKYILIAHSEGGLAARAYLTSDFYNNDVEKLITVDTPHLGSDAVIYKKLLYSPENIIGTSITAGVGMGYIISSLVGKAGPPFIENIYFDAAIWAAIISPTEQLFLRDAIANWGDPGMSEMDPDGEFINNQKTATVKLEAAPIEYRLVSAYGIPSPDGKTIKDLNALKGVPLLGAIYTPMQSNFWELSSTQAKIASIVMGATVGGATFTKDGSFLVDRESSKGEGVEVFKNNTKRYEYKFYNEELERFLNEDVPETLAAVVLIHAFCGFNPGMNMIYLGPVVAAGTGFAAYFKTDEDAILYNAWAHGNILEKIQKGAPSILEHALDDELPIGGNAPSVPASGISASSVNSPTASYSAPHQAFALLSNLDGDGNQVSDYHTVTVEAFTEGNTSSGMLFPIEVDGQKKWVSAITVREAPTAVKGVINTFLPKKLRQFQCSENFAAWDNVGEVDKWGNFTIKDLNLAEGQNVIAFRAESWTGNKSNQQLKIILNTIPQFVSNPYPEPNSSTLNVHHKVGVEANKACYTADPSEKIQVVSFQVDGAEKLAEATITASQESHSAKTVAEWTPTDPLPEGQHDVLVRFQSNVGVSQAIWSFVVDTTAPTVSVATLEPYSARDPTGKELTVKYNTDDNYSSFLNNLSVRLYRGTVPDENSKFVTEITQIPTQAAGEHFINWDGKDANGDYAEDGIYTIRIKAFDQAGNWSSATAQVDIDSTPPQVVEAHVSPNPMTSSSNEFGFAGKISEKSTVILKLTNQSDNQTTAYLAQSSVVANGASELSVVSYLWRFDDPFMPNLSDGIYSIEVIARDEAGNESNPYTISNIKIDRTSPVIFSQYAAPFVLANSGSNPYQTTLRYQLSESNDTADNRQSTADGLTVKVKLYDENSGEMLWLQNASGSLTSENAFSWNASDSSLAKGSYKFQIIAYDSAGNYSTAYATCVKDGVAPAISSPLDGAEIAGTITVRGTAMDPDWTNSLGFKEYRVYYQSGNHSATINPGPGWETGLIAVPEINRTPGSGLRNVSVRTVQNDATLAYFYTDSLVDGDYTILVVAEEDGGAKYASARTITVSNSSVFGSSVNPTITLGDIPSEITFDGDNELPINFTYGGKEINAYVEILKVTSSGTRETVYYKYFPKLSAEFYTGQPSYESGDELGYFIWQDEAGWHVRWNGGSGDQHRFSGSLVAAGSISEFNPIGDGITQISSIINWDRNTSGGEGGFDFKTDSGQLIISTYLDNDPATPDDDFNTMFVPFFGISKHQPAFSPVIITGLTGQTGSTGKTVDWDGKTDSGAFVDSGNYVVRVRAEGADGAGLTVVEKNMAVNTPFELTNVSASATTFNPVGMPDRITVSYNISKDALIKLKVYQPGNSTPLAIIDDGIQLGKTNPDFPHAISWRGNYPDNNGTQVVTSGDYTLKLVASAVDGTETIEKEIAPNIQVKTLGSSSLVQLDPIGEEINFNGGTVRAAQGSSDYYWEAKATGTYYAPLNYNFTLGVQGQQKASLYPYVPFAGLMHRGFNRIFGKIKVRFKLHCYKPTYNILGQVSGTKRGILERESEFSSFEIMNEKMDFEKVYDFNANSLGWEGITNAEISALFYSDDEFLLDDMNDNYMEAQWNVLSFDEKPSAKGIFNIKAKRTYEDSNFNEKCQVHVFVSLEDDIKYSRLTNRFIPWFGFVNKNHASYEAFTGMTKYLSKLGFPGRDYFTDEAKSLASYKNEIVGEYNGDIFDPDFYKSEGNLVKSILESETSSKTSGDTSAGAQDSYLSGEFIEFIPITEPEEGSFDYLGEIFDRQEDIDGDGVNEILLKNRLAAYPIEAKTEYIKPYSESGIELKWPNDLAEINDRNSEQLARLAQLSENPQDYNIENGAYEIDTDDLRDRQAEYLVDHPEFSLEGGWFKRSGERLSGILRLDKSQISVRYYKDHGATLGGLIGPPEEYVTEYTYSILEKSPSDLTFGYDPHNQNSNVTISTSRTGQSWSTSDDPVLADFGGVIRGGPETFNREGFRADGKSEEHYFWKAYKDNYLNYQNYSGSGYKKYTFWSADPLDVYNPDPDNGNLVDNPNLVIDGWQITLKDEAGQINQDLEMKDEDVHDELSSILGHYFQSKLKYHAKERRLAKLTGRADSDYELLYFNGNKWIKFAEDSPGADGTFTAFWDVGRLCGKHTVLLKTAGFIASQDVYVGDSVYYGIRDEKGENLKVSSAYKRAEVYFQPTSFSDDQFSSVTPVSMTEIYIRNKPIIMSHGPIVELMPSPITFEVDSRPFLRFYYTADDLKEGYDITLLPNDPDWKIKTDQLTIHQVTANGDLQVVDDQKNYSEYDQVTGSQYFAFESALDHFSTYTLLNGKFSLSAPIVYASSYITNQETVTIYGTAEPGSVLQLYVTADSAFSPLHVSGEGGPSPEAMVGEVGTDGNFSFENVQLLQEGENYIYVTSHLEGNRDIMTFSDVMVEKDTVPPTLSAKPNLYAFSPNNDGKYDSVDYIVKTNEKGKIYLGTLMPGSLGTLFNEEISAEPGKEYRINWAESSVRIYQPGITTNWTQIEDRALPSTYPDGEYVATVYAIDEAGNISENIINKTIVDTTPPSILTLNADPNPFTPNDDGVKDTTAFNYQLSEPAYVTTNIYREDGGLFRKRDGQTENFTYPTNPNGEGSRSDSGGWQWNGRGSRNELIGGEYTYSIIAEDRVGNTVSSESKTIVVDREPSLVPYAFAEPDPFAPVNPDNSYTEIKYYLSRDNLKVSVGILGNENNYIKTLTYEEIQNKGEHSIRWYGDFDSGYEGPKASQNQYRVGDGSYQFRVYVEDMDSVQPANITNTVLVDNIPPNIVAGPVMVDYSLKKATLTYNIPENSTVEVGVYGEDDSFIATLVSAEAKSPGGYTIEYDFGQETEEIGKKYFKIIAIDRAKNTAEKITESFAVNPNPVQITNPRAIPSTFTPNGDGFTDLTRISYQISGGVPDYKVSVNILAGTGATVKRLVENEPQGEGTYSFYWDGLTDSKQLTADGNYECVIVAEDKLGIQIEERLAILVVSTRPTVDLSITPSIFSPNGDGSSDTLTINYSIDYPVQYITGEALVKLEVIDSSTSEVVWSKIFNHTAGSYAYDWDGTLIPGNLGTSIPAGNYYLRATAQDALGSTAIPKMVEFEVDYTQPEPSDFTITPQYAKLGARVTINLDFEEALSANPSVAIHRADGAFTAVSLESTSGNSYTYAYTVSDSDPEGITTVSVEAVDLALNTITKTGTFVIDKTDPQVSNVTVSPNPASIPEVSGQVSIRFNVSETLDEVPKVYVIQNAAAPQMAVVSGDWDQTDGLCEAKYDVITGYDGPALITIEVTDLAENLFIDSFNGLLTINTTAPVFSNIQSEISSNPEFSTFAKEGSEVSISFKTSEDLQFNPEVRINGNLTTYDSQLTTNNQTEYTYKYTVSGNDAEGNAAITISGYDPAGNEGIAETSSSSESFVIDLENPVVVISEQADMIANPRAFSTNANPDGTDIPRSTTLYYKLAEKSKVTVKVYKVSDSQQTYSKTDFNGGNLIAALVDNIWQNGDIQQSVIWNGNIENNEVPYDANNDGYADAGKYAFIVEGRDRAGNLTLKKWGGTVWIQNNVLTLGEPDQLDFIKWKITPTPEVNPDPHYISPNGNSAPGIQKRARFYFMIDLSLNPDSGTVTDPERIEAAAVIADTKAVGKYSVKVYGDIGLTNLIRTVTTDAVAQSAALTWEDWNGKDDNGQFVADGTYYMVVDVRDYADNPAESNLLTRSVVVDNTLPVVSNLSTGPYYFSPGNTNSTIKNTTLTYEVSDNNGKAKMAVDMFKGTTFVKTLTSETWKDNGIYDQLWNGSGQTGYVGTANGSGFGDGIYTFKVSAIDEAGNSAEVKSKEVYVDTRGPNPPGLSSITHNGSDYSPVSPSWSTHGSPYIEWGDPGDNGGSGVVRYEVSIDGGSWSDLGTQTYWHSTLADGDNRMVDIRAMDALENIGTTARLIFKIDTVDPYFTSGPTIDNGHTPVNTWSTHNSPHITFSGADATSGVASYSVFIDGIESANKTSPWHEVLTDGTHTVKVRVYDNAGRYTDSPTYTFKIDTTPPGAPSVSVAHTPVNTWSNHNSPQFSWSDPGDGNGSGVSYYRGYIDGVDQGNVSSGWHPTLSDGTHTVYIKAIDGVGLSNNSQTFTFKIDTVAPNISNLASGTFNPYVDDNIRVDFTASDASPSSGFSVSNITAKIKYGANDVKNLTVYDDSGGNYHVIWDGTNNPGDFVNEGDYVLEVTASDAVGNPAIAKTSTITLQDDQNISNNLPNSTDPYLNIVGNILYLGWVEGIDSSLQREVDAYAESASGLMWRGPDENKNQDQDGDSDPSTFNIDMTQTVTVWGKAFGNAERSYKIMKAVTGTPQPATDPIIKEWGQGGWDGGDLWNWGGDGAWASYTLTPGNYYLRVRCYAWVASGTPKTYMRLQYTDNKYNYYVRQSSDYGQSWGSTSGPEKVDSYSTGPLNRDTPQHLHSVYISGGDLYYQRRYPDEQLIGTARLTNTGHASNPSLQVDSLNNCYVGWVDIGDDNWDIFFQKIPLDFAPVNGSASSTFAISVPGQTPTTQSTTLEVPILIAPKDINDVEYKDVTSLRPTFEWQHRKRETQEYKIDLAKNDSFVIDHQTFTKAPNAGSVDKNDPTLYHYTYSIHEFDPGLDRDTYYWKVTATSTSESATSEVRSFTVAPQLTLTGVTNYPNPFNPNRENTKIRYRLGADADSVKIRIYDITGSLVKQIDNCPTDGEGSSVWSKYNDVDWDGRNGRGDLVRNGIYPFEIVARLGDKSVSARGKVAVLK